MCVLCVDDVIPWQADVFPWQHIWSSVCVCVCVRTRYTTVCAVCEIITEKLQVMDLDKGKPNILLKAV